MYNKLKKPALNLLKGLAPSLSRGLTIFVVITTIIWAFGVPVGILLPIRTALAVSGVAGVDSDTTGPGLDGRDFSISWTPGAQPGGYTGTQIFIFLASMDPLPTAANVLSSGCSGGTPCQPRGFFNHSEQNNFTLPQFTITDSNNNPLAAGNYKACVYTAATTNTLECTSTAFAVTSDDAVTDISLPVIDHLSVAQAQAQTVAVINTFIIDDQTTAAQFANLIDGGAEYVKLAYGSNLVVTETRVDAVSVEGKLFQFTVPAEAVPAANGTFQYYITAKDRAGNERFFCVNPGATTAVDCKAAPFIVNTIAAGARSVAGTIRYNTASGTPSALATAKVFPAGFAKTAVTAGGDGTYTITNLPNNSVFEFIASKNGYTKNTRMEMVATSDLTDIDINLNVGDMGYSSGSGMHAGDMSPHVVFTGPAEGVQDVPLSENIRVGLDQLLNAQTVNDADASNAGSNVYLTTDGATRLGGTVTWCPNQSSPGCSALIAGDTNVILFDPTANFTANTFYTLIVTEKVVSLSGQSIADNRQGGGLKLTFTTSGDTFSSGDLTTNFGSGGQYLPPYVKSTLPAPGNTVAPNVKPLVEFNETMGRGTLTSTNVKLVKLPSTAVTSTVSIDSNETRFVTLTPQTTPANTLTAGDYEIQVLGAVANARGMTMRPAAEANSIAFRATFTVGGSADSSPPTIYPMVASGGTIAVNEGRIEFGFTEPLAATTVTSSNITLKRGATAVNATIKYDTSSNSVYVIPDTMLVPNTTYTVTIGTGVTDLPGNGFGSASSYTYTTGSADTTAPKIKEARCDDYTCTIFFNEPMNHDSPADSKYANSVLNAANWTVQRTAPDTATLTITGKPITYDGKNYSVTIQGVAGLAYSNTFRVTAATTLKDLTGNAIDTTGSANIIVGVVENSKATFGSFGDTGMFGPPVAGVGTMGPPVAGVAGTTVTLGVEFKPQGFGTFTAEQFALDQADLAFPFNPTASQSSNVFQVHFSPGAVLATGDLVELTFPKGTGITNASQDTFSPFKNDFNESTGAGTITFGTLDTDGIAVDTAALTVTVQLAITGTPGASDSYTIDLKGITNPAVPKGPESGGYTVGIKVKRSTPAQIVVNKTSIPYFIMAGGANSITVKVYAGSVSGITNANGNVHLWGGGPGGPMDKSVTLTNGITTAADGTAITGDAGIVYSNLPNGCYFLGTDPFVTLGSSDYFGQMLPEPVCVSGGTSTQKNIILTAASGTGTVDVTVKLAGIADFGGVDIDIFAGGPGKFVVKTLSNVTTPNANGYTITLNSNGVWDIGVGPAMPKGISKSMPKALPGVPPPPVDINVSGLPGTGTIATGFRTPPGVSVVTATKTITFTFATADKTVSGTVNDGTTVLANVNVFMHALGFGLPIFTTTKSDGTFSLSVSELGSYEIGVGKDGLSPTMYPIELRTNNPATADNNTSADVYFKGKVITIASPLVISLKKGAYTISGKVLDADNKGIAYAPVFATDTNGNMVPGGTSSDGSYTIFVDAGTWTLKVMLPPEKTETCGTLSKEVVISTESKANQNITPSTSTCYTISGTVTVAGATLNNAPLFVDEWDTTNNRPATGGTFKGTSTNSSGVYSVKVKGSATYRIGTWSPDYGELSVTQAVTTANVANVNINSGTTGTVTVAFTGGAANHEAFIELKKSDDAFTRVGKTVKGLTSSVTFTMKEGTYNYFVNVIGVGKYSGTVATGATATINLASASLVTLSGNVKNNANTPVAGALITAKASDGTTETATTDSSGNYSLSGKPDTYTVSVSKSQYIAGQTPASVAVTANTADYDFGGTNPDQTALKVSDQIISGTVYQSNGTTAATTAMVTATESTTGITVTAPVDSVTGAYSLPVDDGTWTVKAVASLHAKTTLSSTVTTTGTTDQTSKNITLTADATKTSTSSSASLSATSGGSVNDTDNTGLKLTAGQGVLETGNVTVSVDVKKTFTAPDTDTFEPLGNAAFSIEARNAESTSSIKDLKGNAEIQIDYTSLLTSLPSGVDESLLQLTYFSEEKDAYVPVEGGFTIDATNNTISGQVNHFTDFVIVYAPVTAAAGRATVALSAPTGVKVSATTTGVTLTWKDPSVSFEKVVILRNSGGNTLVSGSEYAVVNPGVQTYTDKAVTAGETYKYIVRVKSGNNTDGNVDAYPVTVPTTTAPAEAPKAVTPIKEAPAEAAPAKAATGVTYAQGDLLQGSDKAVYYYGTDGKRHAFPDVQTFTTWFGDFKAVKKVADSDLAGLTLGSTMVVRPGTKLIKIQTDPKTYAVEPGGVIRWVKTEAVAKTLYGDKWNKMIVDVPVAFFATYKRGDDITATTVHPTGTLVKYQTEAKVYYIENGKKRHIKDWATFTANNFKGNDIIVIPDTFVYEDGAQIAAKEGALIKAAGF